MDVIWRNNEGPRKSACKAHLDRDRSQGKVVGGVESDTYKSEVDGVAIGLVDLTEGNSGTWSATLVSPTTAIVLTGDTAPIDSARAIFATHHDRLLDFSRPDPRYDLLTRITGQGQLAVDKAESYRNLSYATLARPLSPEYILPIAKASELAQATNIEFGGYGCQNYRSGMRDCRAEYRKVKATGLTQSEDKRYFVITFSKGKGPCYGDGGGPAVGQINGQPKLLGVFVSFADQQADCGGRPALFRKLDDLMPALQSANAAGGYVGGPADRIPDRPMFSP